MQYLKYNKRLLVLLFIVFIISGISCTGSEKDFTIWIGGSPEEVNYWAKLIDQFNKSTGDNLQLVRQPTYTDQRRQALAISLEAKQPDPDLFLMDVVWIDQFARSNWLQSLDGYIKSSSFNTEVFFTNILNSVDKYNGNLFALPVFMDVGLLYYRPDLLKQSGFDSPPETWKELVNESEKIQREQRIKNKSFSGFVWQGAQYEGLVCDFLEFIASNGGGIMRNGKIDLDTKTNIEALQFMQNLIHKYRISPSNTYTEMKEEEARRAFQRGDALFERNWTYAWKLHQSSGSTVKGKVGVALLPHFDDHKSVSALGGWHIGISRFSDEKVKAWKFIQYVTSYIVQKDLVLNVGWNPGRRDVYKDSVVLSQIPQIKTFLKAFDHAVARPELPYYSQVSDVIQRYVNDCLAEKISAADALKKMQTEINKLVEIYGG